MNINNLSLTSIAKLANDGKEILFISVNRETPASSSNVKGKMKSLKEYGVCSPLILLPAKYAAEEGLELLDDKGSLVKDEERIKNAYVITDGNNRYKAYLAIGAEKAKAIANGKEYEEGKGLDEIPCIIQNEKPELGVLKTLIEMNTTAISWKGFDYAKTAAKLNPDNEVMKLVVELVDGKMSLSTISLFLCFGKSLTPKAIANLIKTGKLEGEGDYKVERARKVLDALKEAGFSQKIINKRYLIEFVIREADQLDKVLEAFKQLTPEEVAYISDSLGKTSEALDAVKAKIA